MCLHIKTSCFSAAAAKFDCYSRWHRLWWLIFTTDDYRKHLPMLPSLSPVWEGTNEWMLLNFYFYVTLRIYWVTISMLFASGLQSFVPYLLSIYWGGFISFASHHILLQNFRNGFKKFIDPSEFKITLDSSVKTTSQCFFAFEEEWHF